MITHQKNAFVTAFLAYNAKFGLHKHFRKCSLTLSSELPQFEKGVPVIAVSNHSSWWDPMLALYLSYFVFKKEFYAIFAEEQLVRYGIFRMVGGLGVNRDSHEDGLKFLKYTRDLLKDHDRMLWICPQGELHSPQVPIEFKKGFAQIVSHLPKVQILKMALSYDFWIEPNPEIVISITKETLVPERGAAFIDTLTTRIASDVQQQLNEVLSIVRTRDSKRLKPIFAKEAGVHPVYDVYRRVKALVLNQSYRQSHGVE